MQLGLEKELPSSLNALDYSDALFITFNLRLSMDIDEKTYHEIEQLIHSDDSPVGIDAKKTHIIIIHKLMQIEKRLDALENTPD